MAFISDHVKESSDKCRECAYIKLFAKLRAVELDRHSILYDEAKMAYEGVVEGVKKAAFGMCNVCPSCKDFEKVYGMKPFEYYKTRLER